MLDGDADFYRRVNRALKGRYSTVIKPELARRYVDRAVALGRRGEKLRACASALSGLRYCPTGRGIAWRRLLTILS
jgi:hypothetical protein